MPVNGTLGLSLALACLMLAGCVTHRGSDRFENLMKIQVGKSIDDPSALRNRNPDLRGSTRKLSNGNSEEQLIFSRDCAALFEIDQATRRIVKWRIDPRRDEDCTDSVLDGMRLAAPQ